MEPRLCVRAVGDAVTAGVAGVAAGTGFAAVGIGILRDRSDAVGLAARSLGRPVAGVLAALPASMGVDVAWRAPEFQASGRVNVMHLAAGRPGMAAVGLLCPVVAAVTIGWLTGRSSTRRHASRSLMLVMASATFSALTAAGSAVAPLLAGDAVVDLRPSPVSAFGAAFGWSAVLGGLIALGAARRAKMAASRPDGARRRDAASRRRRVAALGVAASMFAAVASTTGAAPASAASGGAAQRASGTSGTGAAQVRHRRAGVSDAVDALRRESGSRFIVSDNPRRGTPSVVALRSRVGRNLATWLSNHGRLFGVADPVSQLRQVRSERDEVGQHVVFEQVIEGVPVYNATVAVNLDRSAGSVEGISNAFRPGLVAHATTPTLSADAAVTAARKALPNGSVTGPVDLYLWADDSASGETTPATLVWTVTLVDDVRQVENKYFVDARSAGRILHVEELEMDVRNRQVHDAAMGTALPGPLVRAEGGEASAVADVNLAYDGTGATYDYYRRLFGRDSYDGAGAPIVSTVRSREAPRPGEPSRPMRNASWSPARRQMLYGEGYAVLDVTGHEVTHAVTERTANLAYRNQSGALNESFSDVFGEMVERATRGTNDWLIGTELPDGPIRSMADPGRFGHPANLRATTGYTCVPIGANDFGGVHRNSGVQNRAFFNLATTIDPDEAARIYYRNLTTLLNANSSFNDSRAGTITAARDLFGEGSPQMQAAVNSWNAVGADGVFEPAMPTCGGSGGGGGGGGCFLQAALSGAGLTGLDAGGAGADAMIATLYQVRDLVLPQSAAGQSLEETYYDNTNRAAQLVLEDADLRMQAAGVVQDLQPAAASLADGQGDEMTISSDMIVKVNGLLDALASRDIASGGGALDAAIDAERTVIDISQLQGLTLDEAVANMSQQVAASGLSG